MRANVRQILNQLVENTTTSVRTHCCHCIITAAGRQVKTNLDFVKSEPELS